MVCRWLSYMKDLEGHHWSVLWSPVDDIKYIVLHCCVAISPMFDIWTTKKHSVYIMKQSRRRNLSGESEANTGKFRSRVSAKWKLNNSSTPCFTDGQVNNNGKLGFEQYVKLLYWKRVDKSMVPFLLVHLKGQSNTI